MRRRPAPSRGSGRAGDEVEPQLGSIDVLVAAAGLGRQQTLEEVSIEDFDEMLAINLRAPFLLAQRTVPGMRERGFGRVLFMSSVAAFTGGVVGPALRRVEGRAARPHALPRRAAWPARA